MILVVSDSAALLFGLILGFIVCFTAWTLRSRKQRSLLNRLYLFMMLGYSVWALAMLGMRITPPDRTDILQFLDGVTYLGTSVAGFYVLIALVFVQGYERLPRWSFLLLVTPAISFFISMTNDYHHLLYQVFSTVRSQIVFGPYLLVNGVYNYLCFIVSFVLLINFARKNPSKLYVQQCAMLVLGGLIPLLVSIIATFGGLDLPITATPLSFLPLLLFNGIAIYRFKLLDITPVATQHIMDAISDCYLILSDKGLVLSYNKPFASVFASRYGITTNRYLRDCVKEDDISKKTAIYNILNAVDNCREAETTISYEQSATISRDGVVQKSYYVTEVSQLEVNGKAVGFTVIFKDITQLKKSMQQLQDSQSRMMEQERFAFLGQMMGGLAHNLKTPIMSIAGCVSAIDDLVDECLSSLEDPQVNNDDYREIYGEMRDWFKKILDSTAYMSDIITAIKGQATSVSTFNESLFSVDELVKRTTLLLRHELQTAGCQLETEFKTPPHQVTLHGDINNLVQVLGNLVSNAIFAQKQVGGGVITIGLESDGTSASICVKDTGPGIPTKIRSRLFKEMATSKGAHGSGLGLYISNAVVHAKFNGTMWCDDNPGGGAIFGMTIPCAQPESEQSFL